ncbi:MAG: hypothetical protein K0R36_3540 [Chryseobacterium sp.]|jgi:hypothetical protein|nr:hypothetical protein [Chryseobacterium sp.]
MTSLIAPEYFNNHIAVEGEIIVKRVPNDTGSVLVWNSITKKISIRTHAEIVSDLNLMTTNTFQNVYARKVFMGGTGNSYETTPLMINGDGANVYPSISLHQPGFYAGTFSYRGNGFYFMNINGNEFDYVRAAGYFKDGSSDNFFLTGGGNDYDSRKKEDSWFHSGRNFPQGTLIETDVDYSVTNGDQFLLELKGNMYGGGNPLIANIQGYIYADTLYSTSGYSTLYYWNYIIALNLNGKLCFWFQSLSYWQGFDVKVTVGYGGLEQGRNRVTSVSDNPDPGGTKRVQINLKHLLTKEELISGNTFWEKKDIGGYWALDSDKPIAGLNGNGAQVILSGGLLASSAYTDSAYIPSEGVFSRGLIQTTEGFQNKWYKPNQRNRIWSFGDSDSHGISYFQGSGHVLGEGINFHFGDASSTGYKTFVQNSGRIFSALDGNSGDWKHKEYDANNYLGADYVGGGQEKPNSIYFGAGKLKLQMLEASQMGTSNFGWSDVLWMSSYVGSDVKKSTAIVSSKYSDRIGFVKQDYDAADWGTFQEFWTTNNLINPASQADLDNYYHINKGGISNQSELVPNGLQSISIGNSGSNFDGELANKTLEGTFASFNGYSKTSKDLGFTLFSPTSTGQGVYYKTWYGGHQTPWKRLAEHSDLSGYVKSIENAYAVGFSSGLSTEAPYIYHSTDGYVFLATQKWVTGKFVNVDGQQDITGLKIIKGRARNTGAGWGNTNTSTDYSFLVETDSGSNADNQYTGSIGFCSNSGTQAGIYVRSNDQNGTSMAFATTNMFSAGPQIAMTIDNQGTVDHVRTRPTFQGNVIWDAGNLTTTMISNWNDKFKDLKYVADLDVVSESGIYRQEGPTSGFSYTTTLNLNSSDGRQQLTIERTGGGMKFRGTNTGSGNSGWSGWNEVYHTGNFNPASYITQSALNTQLGNYATLNGVQTFTNTNTFLQSPVIPNGTFGTHAVNKNQIELSTIPENEGGQQLNISGNNSVNLTNFYVTSRDGSRNPDDIAPSSTPRRVRFDFANSTSAGLEGSGNYAGIMTFAPWDGTTASTGDSSYQLAFANQSGVNGSGIPMLKIRKGIDGKWTTSWYKFWTQADFTITNIQQWNYMAQYGLQLNSDFTVNTGSGLVIADDYFGGESGIIDNQQSRLVATKRKEYYFYGSEYDRFDGLNFHWDRKLFGMGREANDNDKLTVEGSVKASQNFKSEDEKPDTIFIPNGSLATLRDEIINDESDYAVRLDPHEYEIDSNTLLQVDDRNRLIHIIGEQIEMGVNFNKIYPKQQIVIYNFDQKGNSMEVQIYGKTIYNIEPRCFLRLYVTKSLRVIAERQQPCDVIG